MRVALVDPPAYTPPYDHALAGALARAGAEVELVTSRFAYGEVPREGGYAVREAFYGWTPRRGRRVARLAQHAPGMVRYATRGARHADVVHWQWLAVQPLDALGPLGGRPRVLTAHDVLPREGAPVRRAAQRRLYGRMNAVVVHSEHGAARLRDEVGVEPERVHVIPHGAFAHLTRQPPDAALPPELAATGRPVVLCFGLIRPYKGVDVLLEAWRELAPAAELWVVGMPRMDLGPLRAAAPPSVRWVPRFVSGAELAAVFRRADLGVLPYREIDQSGVLFTALAFGLPVVASAVGGFGELAATGAAELVPPGDPAALATALGALLADRQRRDGVAAAARRAAAPDGPHGWDTIALRHLALYAELRQT